MIHIVIRSYVLTIELCNCFKCLLVELLRVQKKGLLVTVHYNQGLE